MIKQNSPNSSEEDIQLSLEEDIPLSITDAPAKPEAPEYYESSDSSWSCFETDSINLGSMSPST